MAVAVHRRAVCPRRAGYHTGQRTLSADAFRPFGSIKTVIVQRVSLRKLVPLCPINLALNEQCSISDVGQLPR
jgi:hypothetical protein